MSTNTRTPAELRDALSAIVEELKSIALPDIADADIGGLAIAIKTVGEFKEAIDIQLTLRVVTGGKMVPGVSTKPEVKQRIWNEPDTVADLAFAQFGLKAFKLLTPAAIEKLGPEGKALVSVASDKPECGRKVSY